MRLNLGGAARALAVPFAKLKPWLAKLLFWRKPALAASTEPEMPAEEPAVAPAPSPETETVETPPARPTFMQRVKANFAFRRKAATDDEATPDQVEATPLPASNEPDQATPEKIGFLQKLKKVLRFRRATPSAEPDADPDAEPETRSEARKSAGASDEAEAIDPDNPPPKPSFPKRLWGLLARKWIWIPAASTMALAVVGSVAWLLVQSSHEKTKLEAELKATKKKLAQQAKPAAVAIAVAPPTAPAPAPPGPKVDPAFEIIGHKPMHESAGGVDESDCVVADREQVAENLKRCIESFNAAVGLKSTASRK